MKRPFLIILIAVMVNACHIYGPAPGEGSKAEVFYAHAEPIINALDEFHNENGYYPESLSQLVPQYLTEYNWQDNSYKVNGGIYELWFSYQGPGINTCVYKPGSKWECSGLI